jgi:hypothetical protein
MATVSKTTAPKANPITDVVNTLTGSRVLSNPVLVISREEAALITDFAKVGEESRNKNKQLSELMYANGKRSFHFCGKDEKDTDLVKFRRLVESYIIKGYDATAQKLLSALPDSLNVSDSAIRKLIISDKLDVDYANLKKAMVKLENDKLSGKTEKAKAKSNEQMIKHYIVEAIKKIEKSKGYTGMSDDLVALKKMNALKLS